MMEHGVVIHAGDWIDVATLDALAFGHSHIPWDTVTPRGIRLLNPGSPCGLCRKNGGMPA